MRTKTTAMLPHVDAKALGNLISMLVGISSLDIDKREVADSPFTNVSVSYKPEDRLLVRWLFAKVGAPLEQDDDNNL